LISGPQVRSLQGPPYQTSFDPPRSINSRRIVFFPPVSLDSSPQPSVDPPRLRAPTCPPPGFGRRERSGAQARSIKGSCGKAPESSGFYTGSISEEISWSSTISSPLGEKKPCPSTCTRPLQFA